MPQPSANAAARPPGLAEVAALGRRPLADAELVARGLDRGGELFTVRRFAVDFEDRSAGQKIGAGRGHAVDAHERALNAPHTGGAMHPLDGQHRRGSGLSR